MDRHEKTCEQKAKKIHGECFFCIKPAITGYVEHMPVCHGCASKVRDSKNGYEIQP